MPQFKIVPPYYVPEEKTGTENELKDYLNLTLTSSLAFIRTQADGMREKLIEGAEGLQWLCYLVCKKVEDKSIVAPTDVDEIINEVPSLTDMGIHNSVKETIVFIRSICSAHCENLKIVKASIIATHQVSAAPVEYKNLLNELTPDAPITPPYQALAPNTLYSGLLSLEAAASSYQQLGKEVGAVGQYSSQRHVPGKQILDVLINIVKQIAAKVAGGDSDPVLLSIWGLCDALESKVKQALVITDSVLIEEMQKFPDLCGAASSNPYIEMIRNACLPSVGASRKMPSSIEARAGRSVSDLTPEETAVNGLIGALQEYIDERAGIKDSSGKTKDYLHLTVFGSWNAISQNSFNQEKQAVEALKAALCGNGSKKDLQTHLSVIKSGNLAKTILPRLSDNALIRAVSGQTPATGTISIDTFVELLIASQASQLKAGYK